MQDQAQRPTILGTRHMVAAGHYLAALAAFEILEAGGNAIDAGVCAGIALAVLESVYVSFGGVAPITLYLAGPQKVVTIGGVGTWPSAASCEYFQRHHQGQIPRGVLRTVIPAAPAAWLMALQEYGSMSFGDVASAAIRFARDGFAMYPLMESTIAASREEILQWDSSAAVFLPNGRPPKTGELFRQSALAATLQYMADEESAAIANADRRTGLAAARRAFYQGDIAVRLAAYHKDSEGLLTEKDLADFHVDLEPPVCSRFEDIEIYGCGPWCQGPMVQQTLAILDGMELRSFGHNSSEYIHVVTEAIKLAAADREAYYGDPNFVDVPIAKLLSRAVVDRRRKQIDLRHASPGLPSATPLTKERLRSSHGREGIEEGIELDTSYVCVIDRNGNAFSATPSDGATASPIVPGLGFVASPRGAQSWTDPSHPSSVMPGKRPRLTPNPALAIRRGSFLMPFGTPGHDTQPQVMVQVFLNAMVFGMDLQAAAEAPRFASLSFPSSSFPHRSYPGRLMLESGIDPVTRKQLAALGHVIEIWPETGPDYFQNISAACMVMKNWGTAVLSGAADPRRPAYAIGW